MVNADQIKFDENPVHQGNLSHFPRLDYKDGVIVKNHPNHVRGTG